MDKPRITKTSIRHKRFAEAIVEGKNTRQAYKTISPDVSDNTASVEGLKYLNKPNVQEEIARRLAQITPEDVLTRIDDISRHTKSDETKLKALNMLGNSTKASIFNQPQAPQVNVLNLISAEDLRKRIEEYNAREITED